MSTHPPLLKFDFGTSTTVGVPRRTSHWISIGHINYETDSIRIHRYHSII